MERTVILERVREVVSDVFSVPVIEITPETQLVLDLEADSLQQVELMEALQDEFEIELDEDEFLMLDTPADIVDLIEEALEEQGR